MDIIVERDVLLPALDAAVSSIERRNTIPILSHVMVDASGADLTITGTNLDITVAATIKAQILKPAIRTLPARELHDIAKKAPAGCQITILDDTKGSRVQIKAGKSKYLLPVLDPRDFPTPPEMKDEASYKMLRSSLVRLIDKTKFAHSAEETRYYLCGGYLHTIEIDGAQLLRMVATDGHRLAMAEFPAPEGSEQARPAIIPTKAVNLMRQILMASEGEAHISVSESLVRLTCGHAVLTATIINGTYPDYVRVVPQGKLATRGRVKASELQKGIDATRIVNEEKGNAVRFELSDQGIVLSARNTSLGESHTQVEASLEGNPVTAGFNGRYLGDVAALIGDADMICEMNDAASPMRVLDATDSSVTFVVMPVRV